MNKDEYLRRCFLLASDICVAANLVGQARHLRDAKIVSGNLFQCALRSYMSVDMTVRMAFGRTMSNPNSVAAKALEAMTLLRAALDHLLCSVAVEEAWLNVIEMRLKVLRHRAWQMNPPKVDNTKSP